MGEKNIIVISFVGVLSFLLIVNIVGFFLLHFQTQGFQRDIAEAISQREMLQDQLRRADEVNLSAAQSAANTQLSELQEELELLQLEVEMRREERVTAEEQVVNAQQQLTQMSGY